MLYRVCFVCTGSICRSPRAESVFRARMAEAGPDLATVLDSGHLRALRRLAPIPADAEKVRLLRSYDPTADDDLDVPDPSYGGMDGFEECLEMVEAASHGLLAAVREQVEEQAA
ncbi:hypothetical protein AB0D14_12390 [Streptomyces sp. NPDC048484]|uniref:arsenate reductase/protein-tyrosine-phosphatase family protein n=1 Tax=Streptomyces sp. NPDC048484 TaxID=3155146 RepID=UPI0034442869